MAELSLPTALCSPSHRPANLAPMPNGSRGVSHAPPLAPEEGKKEGSFLGRGTQLCPCVVSDGMTQRGAMPASPCCHEDTGSTHISLPAWGSHGQSALGWDGDRSLGS